MRILDRYVIKQFLLTALFGLLAFTLLFLVIDGFENLDDFIDKGVKLHIIVQYYLYFTPEIIKLMIPVAMLLSSLFTTGRMSNQNETTAIKSSGISLYRFLTPLLIVALIVSLFSVYFNGWVVPFANKKKFHLARVYMDRYREGQFFGRYNIYMQDTHTRMLSIGYFDETLDVATRVSIQDFSDTNLTHMVARFDATQMKWDGTSREWILLNGMQRTFRSAETVLHFDTLDIGKLHFTPDDIVKKMEKPDEMDYFDMKQFIENQRRSGNEVAKWMVDFYGKISFPFASFIVVLFGVPFSFNKRRSGLAMEFGISLLICFFYMVFLKVSQAFGYNGDLDPLFTAWFANLLFLSIGIVNLIRVKK
jgi:lipopolysaccharide export system permease protein